MLTKQSRLIEIAALVALLAAAVALRWWTFETGRAEFDGDEAITSLMAKDIWLGRDYPIFFTAQTYGGAIESYFTALVFAARGRADIFGVRIAGVAMMLAALALFYCFIRWATAANPARRGAVAMALALLVFGPGFFVVWSIKQRGGYLMLPILSLAILWLAMALDEAAQAPATQASDAETRGRGDAETPRGGDWRSVWLAGALGLAIGLGWWTHRAVAFAIGALLLALAWRGGAALIARRRLPFNVWRGISLGSLAVLFFLALDQPLSDAWLTRFGLGPVGALAGLARLTPVLIFGAALAAVGGRRWRAGVAGCLIGYAPVLWFMAHGGAPLTPFRPATPGEVADNARIIAGELVPRLFGLLDLLAGAADAGASPASLMAPILLALLAGAAALAGLGAAVAFAFGRAGAASCAGDFRARRFAMLMLLWAAVTVAAPLASGFTRFVLGEPRQIVTLVYPVAALCAMGWIVIGARLPVSSGPQLRRLAPWAAAGALAVYGVSSTVAVPPRKLNADGMPARYERLIEWLSARGVRACYVMDHSPSRGYWQAMEWTFYCDERILFAPPAPPDRLPRHAQIARAEQRPAVWVSQFPKDLIEGRYNRYFERPLTVVDLGGYRVALSNETERMHEVVYLLKSDPWNR